MAKRAQQPPRPLVQFAFKTDPALVDELDRWRMNQIGPPSRTAAVRWILEQYLQQVAAPGEPKKKRTKVK